MQEAPPKQRDSKQDLPAWYAAAHDVRDGTGPRRFILAHGVELGLVAAAGGPGPVKVVGQKVDGVEVLGGAVEVDVLQDVLVGGEGSGHNVAVLGHVDAHGGQEGQEVAALLRVGGIFPDDW